MPPSVPIRFGDAENKKVAVTAGVSGIFVDQGLIWIAAACAGFQQDVFPMQQVDVVAVAEKTYYSSVTGIQVRPRYFIRHGDSISIYPRPQAKDTISVYYYARASSQRTRRTWLSLRISFRGDLRGGVAL